MNRRGVTLIELLITLMISSIAMMALAIPFVTERAMALSGKAQAESQRDAEMVMRAIARVARESNIYTPFILQTLNAEISFNNLFGPGSCFKGGPNFNFGGFNGALVVAEACVGGALSAPRVLIDGNRSNVEEFSVTPITNKLVRVTLRVSHQPIVGGPRQEDEVLETEIFLRNAP